jgi:hypothetical protein
MGRKTLIQEKKHPFYFKHSAPLKSSSVDTAEQMTADAGDGITSLPEVFMEQVMEGLSDACMLVDSGDRLVYVNGAAKNILQPKGRILGRKLRSLVADPQLSTLTAEAYQTGKPLFSTVDLLPPESRWREPHRFHLSIVPLWISNSRRLVRIALRNAEEQPEPRKPVTFNDTVLQMRNPLTILQGYLENLLDGLISDPAAMRNSLLTMRKHTLAMERLLDSCR